MKTVLTKDEKAAIRQAAMWYATLESNDVRQSDHEAWKAWHLSHPLHQKAWKQIEAIRADFSNIPDNIASPVLTSASNSRRTVLKGLVVALATGSAAWSTYQLAPWERWMAGYQTAIGERREIILADGTSLSINTDTSLDVVFDDHQRLIKLYSGEILIKTAIDPHKVSRPFSVETKQGKILALGTRFSVKTDDTQTTVSVFEKTVKVSFKGAQQNNVMLHAEQKLHFTSSAIGVVERYNPLSITWRSGSVTVIDVSLDALITELSRYRTGLLRCDSRIADIKVSGTFPIDDTDRSLKALENGFPISIVRRTGYWITLIPKQT